MYRPSNKTINNLHTGGGEYVFGRELKPYRGYYHKLPSGLFFSGKNPSSPNKFQIFPSTIPIPTRSSTSPSFSVISVTDATSDYIRIKSINTSDKEVPLSYYSFPSLDDINFGVYDRYFSYQINTKSIIEIDKETYDSLPNVSNPSSGFSDKYVHEMYNAFTIPWTITGEEETIFQTNLNAVKIVQQRNNIPDNLLEKYFQSNYTQYSQKYPGVIVEDSSKNIRSYPDKENIPKSLPKVYQMGNQVSYQSNLNVPEKQNCSNCIFHKNNYCNKWKAPIRLNYWCAAYNGEYGMGQVLESLQSSPTLPPPPSYTSPESTPSTPSTSGGGYSGGSGY